MRNGFLHLLRRKPLGWLTGVIATVAAASATALPSQGVEVVVRHATEPSTGSMVFVAIVVLASVRQKRRTNT